MIKHTLIAAAVMALGACDAQTETNTGKLNAEASVAPVALPAVRPDVLTDRFAAMALTCVHQEYPNKISHVMNGAEDAKTPSELTPAFYGCFDWHSSVHGHWLLARLMKLDPSSPFLPVIESELARSFTAENMAVELEYYTAEGRNAFERPYGVAWYLQLIAELEESDVAVHKEWRKTLQPLEDAIVGKISAWLPKLAYPVRLGTHNQTAFAFGLMIDYARTVKNTSFETLLADKVRGFHAGDINCPLAYEPSGEDFLSPCLMEADLVRRVMDRDAYGIWLKGFLPSIPEDGAGDWLAPAIVLDATDGKLVHLDGVNLSRAWALEGIASALSEEDPRRAALLASSEVHKETGIKSVSDSHYAGSHWLASFATYLTTKRGIARP